MRLSTKVKVTFPQMINDSWIPLRAKIFRQADANSAAINSYYLLASLTNSKDRALEGFAYTNCKDSFVGYMQSYHARIDAPEFRIILSLSYRNMQEFYKMRLGIITLVNKFEEFFNLKHRSKIFKIIELEHDSYKNGYALEINPNKDWFNNKILTHIYLNLLRAGAGYSCEPIDQYNFINSWYYKKVLTKHLGCNIKDRTKPSYDDTIAFCEFYLKFSSILDLTNKVPLVNWNAIAGDLYTSFNQAYIREYSRSSYLHGFIRHLFKGYPSGAIDKVIESGYQFGLSHKIYYEPFYSLLPNKQKGVEKA